MDVKAFLEDINNNNDLHILEEEANSHLEVKMGKEDKECEWDL